MQCELRDAFLAKQLGDSCELQNNYLGAVTEKPQSQVITDFHPREMLYFKVTT